MNTPRYTVIIQWSDEDQAYIATLPEWNGAKTHGDTYEEAARRAQEVLESLVDGHKGELPSPKLFSYPGADVVNVSTCVQGTATPITGSTRVAS